MDDAPDPHARCPVCIDDVKSLKQRPNHWPYEECQRCGRHLLVAPEGTFVLNEPPEGFVHGYRTAGPDDPETPGLRAQLEEAAEKAAEDRAKRRRPGQSG